MKILAALINTVWVIVKVVFLFFFIGLLFNPEMIHKGELSEFVLITGAILIFWAIFKSFYD